MSAARNREAVERCFDESVMKSLTTEVLADCHQKHGGADGFLFLTQRRDGAKTRGWKGINTEAQRHRGPLGAEVIEGITNPQSGFTLIEMLVVISVIAILAAMIVQLGPLASRKKIEGRARSELAQLETVIESYKSKKGFYPPSNAKDVTRPPLFYELAGTVKTNNNYETVDRKAQITSTPNQLTSFFGVDGFINSMGSRDDQDATAAEPFHKNLKDTQVFEDKDPQGNRVKDDQGNYIKYLGINYRGPDGEFSRWRYNSANPTNNPEGFDVWVELDVGGQTKIFGNWKQ